MELTPEQEQTVHRIMKGVDCPKDFRCHGDGFENLCRAIVYQGADLVQCQSLRSQKCPMSYVFCGDIRFCTCQLRKYIALELGR